MFSFRNGSVAQLEERKTHNLRKRASIAVGEPQMSNLEVARSKLARATIFSFSSNNLVLLKPKINLDLI